MPTPRAYYTLCQWHDDEQAWYDIFGDYSRRDVEAERDDLIDSGFPRKHFAILRTDGSAADMIAQREGLAKVTPRKGARA